MWTLAIIILFHAEPMQLDYIDFPLREICLEAAEMAEDEHRGRRDIKKFSAVCFKKLQDKR